MAILITGLPGSGKTTLIRKIARALPGAAGFYTEEIRERGLRRGFRLASLDGRTGVLSHVDIRGPRRVGRYGVDVDGFEAFLENLPLKAARIVVMDEIGKMECLSPRFRELITQIISSPAKTAVATIALRGTPFIESLKRTQGARLVELTVRNRDALADEILKQFSV